MVCVKQVNGMLTLDIKAWQTLLTVNSQREKKSLQKATRASILHSGRCWNWLLQELTLSLTYHLITYRVSIQSPGMDLRQKIKYRNISSLFPLA